jgi:hypothetical protein
MTEPELRQVLKSILEAGMIGRLHPDQRIETPACGPLLRALGTIAGLATVALEGGTLPPDRVYLQEGEIRQLSAGEPVILTTRLGYRVELRRVPDGPREGGDHGL